jgi:hypothetical protein
MKNGILLQNLTIPSIHAGCGHHPAKANGERLSTIAAVSMLTTTMLLRKT